MWTLIAGMMLGLVAGVILGVKGTFFLLRWNVTQNIKPKQQAKINALYYGRDKGK